ncbi:Cuticlin-1 [Orchesella cincta]|uniref:Cuticlin-1 n=1 Tax=Orchesella cincta TaxID=48709 RepID=A0A1D2MZY1_ORCCI|nr:Cuticlin-1 [Orchesella cincta]
MVLFSLDLDSFVVNPLAPVQETLCLLQNDTTAHNPSAEPQKAASMYYMVKLHIRSEKVCSRPWTFERVPNKMIRNNDDSLIFTSTKEACLAACLNERRFTCRSAEYNYVTLQCHLSQEDRRTVANTEFIDATGVDYFENLCLQGNQTCKGKRAFAEPSIGVPQDRISHYVGLHYYVDKEMQTSGLPGCKRACETEDEFLCRSFLFKPTASGTTSSMYNCQLYHLDHHTLPDGPATYLNTERPLLDNGSPLGQYQEGSCDDNTKNDNDITRPPPSSMPQDIEDAINPGTFKPPMEGEADCDHTGTCYDVQVQCKDTRIAVQVRTNKAFNGRIYAMGRSETCNVDVIDSDVFRLDLSLSGQDCNTQSVGGVYTNTVVLQHHSVVMTKADKIYKVKCTYDISSRNITFGMMPIRDPDTISITSAPEAPPPKIRILDAFSKEVETVRIGDRLTFRIEIPNNTPYGIFARSCIAMAKDSRSTFNIIDDEGCPVEPSIFPKFEQTNQYSLFAEYEAFRFTESYGVIFQCNVKYCLGPCPAAECTHNREAFPSYGRRKRRGVVNDEEAKSLVNATNADLTLSQEILVLDFNEELPSNMPKYSMPNEMDNTIGGNAYPNDKFTGGYGRSPYGEYGNSYNSGNSGYGPHRPTYSEEYGPSVSCPTRNSVLVLSVVCAMLLLLYVASAVCFMAKSRPWRGSSMGHHKHIMQ